MNYEEMSDFEINKSVAGHLGVFWHVKPCNSETNGWLYSENYEMCDTSTGQIAIELPDYCNNPSDAWPIIIGNLIGVSPDEDGVTCRFYSYWTATAFCSQKRFTHKNPLRAAMIVFLMMQEQDK